MNLENYSGMRSCLPQMESQILPTPYNTLEYNFSNSKTTLKVIIQPRHANFATCGLYVVWNPGETLEDHKLITRTFRQRVKNSWIFPFSFIIEARLRRYLNNCASGFIRVFKHSKTMLPSVFSCLETLMKPYTRFWNSTSNAYSRRGL